jgi:hypothetical protein
MVGIADSATSAAAHAAGPVTGEVSLKAIGRDQNPQVSSTPAMLNVRRATRDKSEAKRAKNHRCHRKRREGRMSSLARPDGTRK